MFTLKDINSIHDRLGRQETLACYLRALAALGVVRADSYLRDGHSEFFAEDGHAVVSPPAHDNFDVADKGNKRKLLDHLRRHEQGQTSYVAMSKALAESGTEKWTMDTSALTISYFDKAGNALLVEYVS